MTREELRGHCERQIQQFERVEKIMPVTPNDWKRYEEHKLILELLEQTRWIPVSERLPEDGTWNLFTDGKSVSVERYKSDAIDHFYPNGRWFSLDEAIAWMPLPKPYEPQERSDKCSKCEYYINPDYTRCKECGAERSDKE